MKLTVEVDGKTFEVEIADINARPVRAVVDGEVFEVTPQETTPPVATSTPVAPSAPVAPQRAPAAAPATASGNAVVAPLPGVLQAVLVKAGDSVAVGQEVCIIEAMKMKNSIRATRAGTVKAVVATIGETVRHGQPIVEFTD